MSGRGNSGAWNGKKNWKQQEGSARKEKKEEQHEKVKEPFLLPGSPGTTTFWLDALFAWAAEKVCQWSWHRVLGRLNPGGRPEAVEPDMPDPDNFETEEKYRIAERVYVNRMTRYDKIVEKMEYQRVLLYNKMKNNCSQRVLRDLEDRHEMEAYQDEDPIVFLNALKVTCLGKQHGQVGNVIDINKQRKKFIGVNQRHGQTVQDFYEYYNQEFDALIVEYDRSFCVIMRARRRSRFVSSFI